MRAKALLDEQSRLNGAKKEGIAEGISKGKAEKARESALNFLKAGIDKETIAKCLELSIEEVGKIEKYKNPQLKIHDFLVVGFYI